MENETSFEIRAYIEGHLGLNVSVSQTYSDFLKEEKVVQLSHPPYLPDLSPCDFFLFPLPKKPFLVVIMYSEVHLVVQFTSVFRVYLKRPTSLPLQNGF